MNGLCNIKKIREYCDYLEQHLMNVKGSWHRLQEPCSHMRFVYDDYVFWSIDRMIKEHDLSKFSSEEFIRYCEEFYPIDGSSGGDHAAFKKAWEHHKENNQHHWENWTAKEFYDPYEAEMHCVCMVVDWMAMGLTFGDTAKEYYEKNEMRIGLPGWAAMLVGEIFKALAKAERAKGEGDDST